MSELIVTMRLSSGLSWLLKLAAEHGFDRVIYDKRDLDGLIGVGFVDGSGGRHALRIHPKDAAAWDDLTRSRP